MMRVPTTVGWTLLPVGLRTGVPKLLAAFLTLSAIAGAQGDAASGSLIPDAPRAILKSYCVDCHGEDTAEAGINLDVRSISWSDEQNTELWEKVLLNSERGIMPPHDHDQPSAVERKNPRPVDRPRIDRAYQDRRHGSKAPESG